MWHTRFGEIKIEEQTYRRGRAGPLMRPFCGSAGVVCQGYSLGLQRVLTDFGADESFAKAATKVKEHYGIEVPESAVRRITQQQAARMRQEQELESRWPDQGVDQVIAEVDGSLVPIVKIKESEEIGDKRRCRQVEWQEARLSLARKAGAVSKHYQATMKSVDEAGAQLLDCVIAVGGGANTKIHCVGDGAAWIVNQVEEKFGESATYLIDFYHMSEYLAGAADSIARPERKTAWLHQQQERLKQNRVQAVLAQLQPHRESEAVEDSQAPVRACERYINNRLPYLDYKGALEAGLPIGSGEVESGHRGVIQARLKLTGAWWKKENADDMLALRTTRANGQWSAYWDAYRQAAA